MSTTVIPASWMVADTCSMNAITMVTTIPRWALRCACCPKATGPTTTAAGRTISMAASGMRRAHRSYHDTKTACVEYRVTYGFASPFQFPSPLRSRAAETSARAWPSIRVRNPGLWLSEIGRTQALPGSWRIHPIPLPRSPTPLLVAELPAEVTRQRINPNAFDGLGVAMLNIKLAAALGVSEIAPVGGFVAGAGKARLFDKGFQQDRTIRVACIPVIGKASANQSEHARSKIFAGYPRQYQEPRVVDDEVQVALALLAGPADGRIARLGFPGACAEAEHRDDLAGGAHEVAQLRAGQRLMAEIMMPFDVRVPQQRVGFLRNQMDTDLTQFHSRHTRRFKHGALDVRMRFKCHGLGPSGLRQCEEGVGLHAQQRHPRTHVLQLPVGAAPVEPFAHGLREPVAIQRRRHRDQLANERDLSVRKFTSAVAHRSTRVAAAQAALIGTQHRHIFVQPHKAAPQHRDAGFLIALAPQVPTEAAEHAHRLAQGGRIGWRQRLLDPHVQHFD